jgi:nucleotide-binding universal stress UspA family protein
MNVQPVVVPARDGKDGWEATMNTNAIQRQIGIDTIVVLTDLEAGADRPLQHAASLARWYGSNMVIAHAGLQDLPATSVVGAGTPQQMVEAKLRFLGMSAGLRDLVPRLLVSDDGIEDLLRQIESCHADLLVLGTHGRSGAAKWLKGSVAEHIFRAGKWPVLVIGPACNQPRAPQVQLRRIVCATDMSRASAAAFAYALGMARDHEANLVMVYVEPQTHADFTFDRTMLLQRLEDWSRKSRTAQRAPSIGYMVEFGNAAENVVRTATEWQADLIVIGAQGAGAMTALASHFIGGTAYNVACASACPVLIVGENTRFKRESPQSVVL